MDIGKAFGYVFEDENWITKVLIGAVVGLIPIVNFALLGYMVRIVQNVRDGNPQPLPEWSDFGDFFMKGLVLFVAILAYSLPIILLFCLLAAGSMIASSTKSDALSNTMGMLSACLNCITILWEFLVFIIFPAVVIQYAATEQLGALFRFGEVFSIITANAGNYIMALLIYLAASFVGGLGLIACGIGVLVTYAYSIMVQGHILGQLAQTVPSSVA